MVFCLIHSSSNGNVFVTEISNSRFKFSIQMVPSLISLRGKGKVHFNNHMLWHLTQVITCMLQTILQNVSKSLQQMETICTQIWKWNFTESNWNCSRSRWLLHCWRWQQKISGHFCPTGKNIVHSVPNFPAWGVTLDRECFVYVTNCTNGPCFKF